jgi:uncharacterized repeat protein (TIGR03803 family)
LAQIRKKSNIRQKRYEIPQDGIFSECVGSIGRGLWKPATCAYLGHSKHFLMITFPTRFVSSRRRAFRIRLAKRPIVIAWAVAGATAALADPIEMTDLFKFAIVSEVRLVQCRDSTFYGTSAHDGAHNFGTVFKLTLDGKLTVLHSFGNPYSSSPRAPLVQGADGNFYGMDTGGAFKMSPNGELQTLHRLGNADATAALTLGSNGDFYGTCPLGGPENAGLLFEMAPEGAVKILHPFSFIHGDAVPVNTLVQGSDGNFYGTTGQTLGVSTNTTAMGTASVSDRGTIFKITPQGDFTILHLFPVGERYQPSGPLVLGRDGYFYGTAVFNTSVSAQVGALGPISFVQNGNFSSRELGMFFRITPNGEFAVLHHFQAGDMSAFGMSTFGPPTSLTLGPDGGFYGNCANAIVRIAPTGELTVLHSYQYDSVPPSSDLVLGVDGNLYGTLCGPTGPSTFFKISLSSSGPVTGDESAQPPPPWGEETYGTEGTVTNGTLTYKDSASGALISLSVVRPIFLPEQMIKMMYADHPSSGPWVSLQGKALYGRSINIAPDGKVDAKVLPLFAVRKIMPP